MLGMVHILLAMRSGQGLRELIADMDDGENCVLDVVTTGLQAIEVCRKTVPDILVIDAVLPGVDGLAVMEHLRREMGSRMPRVIGCSRTSFSRMGFLRRGAKAVVSMPWNTQQLKSAILQEMADMETQMKWDEERQRQAGILLGQMGMHTSLKGYEYLSCAAALALENESRQFAVSKAIYVPIARRYQTTPQNVERLIRHAIESTMSAARAKGVYTLFGNTIDPAKGKPTNAQAIALLVQKLRVESLRAERKII